MDGTNAQEVLRKLQVINKRQFKMKKKRIYLKYDMTKYCDVFLFDTRKELRAFYAKHCPKDGNHHKVRGVSVHRDYYQQKGKSKKWVLMPKTGEVLLSLQDCGAGVVTHEFMHATIWAFRHNGKNDQYPFVIRNMREEEKLLHGFTFAVMQFYRWYYQIIDSGKQK